jgi:hypothetical protein
MQSSCREGKAVELRYEKGLFIFYFLVFPKDSQTARLASDATIKVKRLIV